MQKRTWGKYKKQGVFADKDQKMNRHYWLDAARKMIREGRNWLLYILPLLVVFFPLTAATGNGIHLSGYGENPLQHSASQGAVSNKGSIETTTEGIRLGPGRPPQAPRISISDWNGSAGTVSFWIKPVDWDFDGTSKFRVISLAGTGKKNVALLKKQAHGFCMKAGIRNKTIGVGKDAVRWENGEWHHLCLTWRTDHFLRFYVDGELQFKQSGNFPWPNKSTGVTIGYESYWRGETRRSYLKDIRILTSAISEQKIKDILQKKGDERGFAPLRTKKNWYSVYKPYVPPREQQYEDTYRGHRFWWLWWAGNQYGYSRKVPEPWGPVRRDGKTLHVWGRSYRWSEEMLPAQIKVKGEPILADPMRIDLASGGHTLSSGAEHWEIVEQNRRHVRIRSSNMMRQINVRANMRLDYDGFLRIDLHLDAPEGTRIDRLELEVPVRQKMARYFLRSIGYDFQSTHPKKVNLPDAYGKLTRSQCFTFRPSVWVGSNTRGLSWVCESNVDWYTPDRDRAMMLTLRDNKVVFRACFIQKPVTLSGDLVYSFALLPTPTKPLQRSRWKVFFTEYHLADWWHEKLLKKFPDVYLGARKRWAHRGKSGAVPVLRFAGLSLPYPDRRFHANFEKLKSRLGEIDGKYVTYSAVTALYNGHPALIKFYDEWKLGKTLKNLRNWGRYHGVPKNKAAGIMLNLTARSAQDFVVAQQVRAIEEYDMNGVFYDLQAYRPTGAVQQFGNDESIDYSTKTYRPLFAWRETMQRIWTATKKRDPKFLILNHGTQWYPFIATYGDMSVGGEMLNMVFRKDPWMQARRHNGKKPPENLKLFNEHGDFAKRKWYRPNYFDVPDSFFHSYQNEYFGAPTVLLPQIKKYTANYMKQHPEHYARMTRQLLGRTLVHNVPLWTKRAHLPTLVKVYRVLYSFGVHRDDVRHLPHWKAGKHMQIRSSGKVHVAAWNHSNTLLIILTNRTPEDAKVTITPPIEWAGWSATPRSATDPLADRKLDVDTEGHISVRIPGKEFKFLQLSAQRQQPVDGAP